MLKTKSLEGKPLLLSRTLDSGKTTLTENTVVWRQFKRLVQLSPIRLKRRRLDFMEIEKQRGISVATSVMSFEYDNRLINILDNWPQRFCRGYLPHLDGGR